MMTAFLLGIIAFIAQCEYALGTSLICRPIVTGLLTGIVMGDIKAGVIMGATLELAFIGSFSVGGSLPPDVVTGGILAIAFSIASHSGVETVLLLALPIATFSLVMKNLYNGIIIPLLLHKADHYAEEGDYKGIEHMHLLAGFGLSALLGLITFVGFYLGGDTVGSLLKAIPVFVQRGLEVATGIIPALGFAMLARLLINKELVVYFLLGFFVAAYFGIPLTGIAIFGAILAVILVNLSSKGVAVRETLSSSDKGGLEDEDF